MSPAETSVGTTPPAPDGGVAGPISLNKVASTGAGLTFRERTIEDRREDARRGIAYLNCRLFRHNDIGILLDVQISR